MLRRITLFIFVFVMTMSLILAGCGKTTSGPENPSVSGNTSVKPSVKTKITYWDENAGPTRTPYHENIIKKFMSIHPDVEIEYIGIPQSSALEKYNTAIAANETPDTAGVQSAWIPNFIAKKAIIQLDPYFDKWSDKEKIMPSVISAVKNLSPTGKDIYMLPYSSNYTGLWYRTDWFKDSGLSFPETWDDFFNAAEKLTDKNRNKYGFTIRGGQGSASFMLDAMYSYTGITSFIDANGKCTVNDPKNIEFLKRFMGIYGKFTPESDIIAGWPEMAANFDTGSCAMLMHNLGSFSNHMDAFSSDQTKFAFGPLPKSVYGNRVMQGGSGMNAASIFVNSKNIDAAWKYISWLAGAESQSIFNKPVGQMPTNRDVLNQSWVKEAQHINIALSIMSDPATRTMTPTINLPDYATIISKIVEPNVQAVYSGKMTVENFTKVWAEAIEKAKAEYDKAKK